MKTETISTDELADLLCITKRQASKIISTINDELEDEGFIIIRSRPLRAPRQKVMERLGITQ